MVTVGIDEVGRGCWAGPLVASAVILPHGAVDHVVGSLEGLRDSKQLTKRQRERLVAEIRIAAVAIGLGWVLPREIDEVGLTEAVRLAMHRALLEIKLPYDEIIIDGNYNFISENAKARAIVKADDLVPCVSAASIVAKVARDKFMLGQAKLFPGYSFDKHVGYGTAAHMTALQKLGICELHRLSFRPVRRFAPTASQPDS